MKRTSLRYVGWALCLAMGIGAIGAAVGASRSAEKPVEAGASSGIYTKVTSTASLKTGDKVILATESDSLPDTGVTGFNSNGKDATFGTVESNWVEYGVTTSGSGFKLYDSDAEKYAGTNSNNYYLGSASGSVFYTNSDGYLLTAASSGRFLGINGGNSRFYALSNVSSYPPYRIWKVTVAKTIASVNVKTAPLKADYRIGELFDPAGLVVTVTYSDASTEDVGYDSTTASKFSFEGFDSSAEAPGQQVTVKYSPKAETVYTCATKVSININEVHPTLIVADATHVKAEYRAGQKLDLTGLEVLIGYSDDSDDLITVESNADFLAKGFVLKLGGESFDLDTTLTAEHDCAEFVVYYGALADATNTVAVLVENIADFTLNNFGTAKFYRDTANEAYTYRPGIVGSGETYIGFEGVWYVNTSPKMQMNKTSQGAYFQNPYSFGRLKTVTLTMEQANGSQFTMYYGTSVGPSDSSKKITATSPSTNVYVYDFSAVTANFFRFNKNTNGNTTITQIDIEYVPITGLDYSEAGAYSSFFLAKTNGLCDNAGLENGVEDVWAPLGNAFSLLSADTKAALKTKALAEKGKADETLVGEAMARYYWAVKNHNENNDFVGNGDILAAAKSINPIVKSNDHGAWIALGVIAMGTLAATGLLALQRRRNKEN